ncbi:putative acyl carrier protein phosphodiesterase, partial [Vibrio parahaemolyticus AQ3810]
CSGTIV